MAPTITIQTRDADLIADLLAATPPAGIQFYQERPASAGTADTAEFVLRHGSAIDPALVAAWLWSCLRGRDSIVLIEHRSSSVLP